MPEKIFVFFFYCLNILFIYSLKKKGSAFIQIVMNEAADL